MDREVDVQMSRWVGRKKEGWLGEVTGRWTGEILLRHRKESLPTHLGKHPFKTSLPDLRTHVCMEHRTGQGA